MGRLSEKAFYSLLIPIACLLFFSAPGLVVHSYYDSLEDTIQEVPNLFQQKIKKWINKKTWPIFQFYSTNQDIEIPLVFLHEKYPNSGKKILHFHDKKYLKMAQLMEKKEYPSELGYIYIFDTKDGQELPKGELIVINRYEWKDDGCTLSTTRKRSFRIKSIRRDPHQGIMFAKIEWI